jgi:hypothetical protein
MKLPNLILIILSIFDMVTTWIALENGGRELNPFISTLGIGWIIIIRIIFVICCICIIDKYIYPYSKTYSLIRYAPLVVYCGISTIWLAAVFNNLLVLLV